MRLAGKVAIISGAASGMGAVGEWLGVQFIRDQAPLWLFGLTPQSTPPSGLLGDRIANVRRKDARCGLGWRKENRPPEWGPRQPSSSRPS